MVFVRFIVVSNKNVETSWNGNLNRFRQGSARRSTVLLADAITEQSFNIFWTCWSSPKGPWPWLFNFYPNADYLRWAAWKKTNIRDELSWFQLVARISDTLDLVRKTAWQNVWTLWPCKLSWTYFVSLLLSNLSNMTFHFKVWTLSLYHHVSQRFAKFNHRSFLQNLPVSLAVSP